MEQNDHTFGAIGRTVLGSFCGVILGILVEGMFFHDGPFAALTQPIRDSHAFDALADLPHIVGPLMGAFVVGTTCYLAGHRELQGLARYAVVEALIGVVVGATVGRLIYPMLGWQVFSGIHERHQEGMLLAIPFGALLGLLGGAWGNLWQNKQRTSDADEAHAAG